MQGPRLLGTRSASFAPCDPQARLLSTFSSQRMRYLARPSPAFPPLSKRNLWLFSSKPSAPTPAPSPPPSPEPIDFQPEPPAEAAAPVDVTSSVLDVPVPNAEDVSSTVFSSSITDTLIGLAPLQYGDLAALGLASWSPAGLSRWLLELVNVSTGMPWFWTIIAGTVFSRMVLFPLAVQQLRNTARLAPHQPRLSALKDELNRAYGSKDTLKVQMVALKQKKVYDQAGVSMLPMLAMPFVQLPVTLGMFFGVKGLCTLPLEQLKYSGVSFLPDLTLADPYYILPIASAVFMNVQLSIGARDMVGDRGTVANMINLFRVVSVISIPVMGSFASRVRRALNIPVLPKNVVHKPITFHESIDSVKKWFREQRAEAEKKALERRKW
ncbi:hypothetical protein EW146_g1953 [Bondarzewia mesenterica]|uniref:Membrane insertase YidC/Oxa/ALB C-terminal domain-containing protein n=1 Tax=Bondarzewia mesenterica TaxID=1095465 RepID=A0A4S4M2B2_9AGAM|nr:hypothetical protein EW146_g1953 [Bondarzewia mesenterica]